MRNGNGREETLNLPCRDDDSCEFIRSEWNRLDSRRDFYFYCIHSDHPDNPRARPDNKCPKLIDGVGRRLS